jgi:hypothetical protein
MMFFLIGTDKIIIEVTNLEDRTNKNIIISIITIIIIFPITFKTKTTITLIISTISITIPCTILAVFNFNIYLIE